MNTSCSIESRRTRTSHERKRGCTIDGKRVDGRTRVAKRYHELLTASLYAMLIDPLHPSPVDLAVISNFALALLRAEQLKAKILNGEEVNDHVLVRLVNSSN